MNANAAESDTSTAAGASTADVVVGVDDSTTAHRAAERAAEIATAMGGGLHVVMSVDSDLIVRAATAGGGFAPMEVLPTIDSDPVASAEGFLAEFAPTLGCERVSTVVSHGSPAELVAAIAADRCASTVVVGNRRVQGASRMLGSVATAVLRSAEADVLVVQTGDVPRPDGDAIVVGVDRSDTARYAAERAAEWASVLGAGLHLVMCTDDTRSFDLRVGTDEFHADAFADDKLFLHDLARSLPHDDVVTRIGSGKPGRGLRDAAVDAGAGTIVVGNRRVRGMSRVLGSVATDVLHHAPCDVLVVDSVGHAS